MKKTENLKSIEKIRFHHDCITHCETNGIHSLSKELLTKKCLRIPDNGLDVIHSYTKLMNTFYPLITTRIFDNNVIKKLGHYNINNDVIVFVHYDGDTYVSKDWSVFHALVESGYTKNSDLFVPLSYDETILEPNFLKRWENLPDKKC